MPGPTEPRTMLYAPEAPEGRIFSAAEAAARLEAGWRDTPLPAEEWNVASAPQDELALALSAFVTIEAPRKDDWLALATAAGAPTEFFGLSASDLKDQMGGILEAAREPFLSGMMPWTFEEWADAIRELLTEPDGGSS